MPLDGETPTDKTVADGYVKARRKYGEARKSLRRTTVVSPDRGTDEPTTWREKVKWWLSPSDGSQDRR